MARRLGSEAPFEVALREPHPGAAERPGVGLDATLSPKTAARLRRLGVLLARRHDGLSFTELRATFGAPIIDLRADLDLALRAGLIRRVGARNAVRYLCNGDRDPGDGESSP